MWDSLTLILCMRKADLVNYGSRSDTKSEDFYLINVKKKKKKKKKKVLLIHYSTHTVCAAKYLINFYIQ
jgi:hypothetical protein